LLERAEFTDSFDCGIRLVLAANEYFAAEFAAGRLVLALDGQQSRLDSGPKRLGVPVKSFANSVQVTLNTVAHPVNAIRDCPAVRLLQRRELAERLHGTVGGHLRCKRKLLTKVAACPRSFLAALTEFFSQILCRFALHQTRNASGEPKRQRERQSANKQQAKS